MITQAINLDDPQTRRFVAEFLDARVAGILGNDWSVEEYIARRIRDERKKLIGGLSADFDDDDFEKEL